MDWLAGAAFLNCAQRGGRGDRWMDGGFCMLRLDGKIAVFTLICGCAVSVSVSLNVPMPVHVVFM